MPDSGTINVSMALTGLGTVYFDDVRIEPMADKEQRSEIVTTSATLPYKTDLAKKPVKTEPRPSGSGWSGKLSTLFRRDPDMKSFLFPQ